MGNKIDHTQTHTHSMVKYLFFWVLVGLVGGVYRGIVRMAGSILSSKITFSYLIHEAKYVSYTFSFRALVAIK
jgi:hypothetical protein